MMPLFEGLALLSTGIRQTFDSKAKLYEFIYKLVYLSVVCDLEQGA